MFNKKLLALATGAALLAGAQNGFAAKVSATLDYEVTLSNGTCTVTAVGKTFDPQPTSVTDRNGLPAGSVEVNCTSGLAYAWGIDGGAHYGTRFSGYRSMSGPGGDFAYDLKSGSNRIGDDGLNAKDPSYTDTTAGVSSLTATGTGAAQTYPLTADLAFTTLATKTPGTYTDTVTVTVVF